MTSKEVSEIKVKVYIRENNRGVAHSKVISYFIVNRLVVVKIER